MKDNENVHNDLSRKNVEDALNLFEKVITRNENSIKEITTLKEKKEIDEIDIMKLKTMLEEIDDSGDFLNKI